MSDMADLTASELLGLFASGAVSPVDAVQACTERISAVDDQLNAVLVLLADDALAQARESEQRWVDGTARPLEGVPYGLKDIIATAGVLTTGGSALYRANVPDTDAALAARLAGAGGIRLAKLHTFEFACGGADNRTFGMCRNPWDTSRTTGGSSSGSGAAVAAGEVPLAIGTDTGGSIRIPAAYCGITGLKPTFGRVPRHGVMGLSWTLDHAGPMTRSVADAALMLGVIAGRDARDPTSSGRPVPDYAPALTASAEGMVIGRPRGWFEDKLQPEVAEAFERAVGEMVAAGVRVVDVDLPDVDLWDVAGWSVMYPEALSLHGGHMHDVENRDAMGAGMLATAPYVHASDYLRGLRYRRVAQGQLETAMQGVAALVTPGAISVAPPLGDISSTDDSAGWLLDATRPSMPFNYTGNPALCLPAGLVDGLPVSLQLVARPHDEASLFTLGAAYQSATDHHTTRPALLAAV
ncbi:MAG: Amidase [Modestobacter sp.]|jgi:aspartyl-tRNA(Asn)/glutamyl-tRNA(Gln) amidotransferase subunit A|nr:Amidase [Modestobacter sp.]